MNEHKYFVINSHANRGEYMKKFMRVYRGYQKVPNETKNEVKEIYSSTNSDLFHLVVKAVCDMEIVEKNGNMEIFNKLNDIRKKIGDDVFRRLIDITIKNHYLQS
jgi:hypothetical protein